MKKLLWMGLLLILSVSCCGFSSCHGPQYEAAERDAMEEAGRKQMQAWLDEHIEGAGVISAEAYIEMYPSGPWEL